MRTLLSLLALGVTTCLAQPTSVNTTDGMNNGYLWETGSPEEKLLYVTGISDGMFLASVTALSKTEADANQVASLSYPKGFLTTDIVQSIDAFYRDRTNVRVPILFSYLYVMTKLKGAPQEDLDAMASRFRRQANR
jgi:hypothetical protein